MTTALLALVGYALIPVGVWLVFGLGWALVATGAECLVVTAALQSEQASQ